MEFGRRGENVNKAEKPSCREALKIKEAKM
jgi:hypothetical protein